ncbi:MAG: quinohemoprotein ethanol dehydrogenase [Arenicella sp.]
MLSTKGNLVFQGDLAGFFKAFEADTGKEIWNYSVQGGVMASPITYELDGVQYVAVAQGWGGESGLPFGSVSGPQNMFNISRLLVFALDASGKLPIIESIEQTLPAHDLVAASVEKIELGRGLYDMYCVVCHGGNVISAGLIPDLRYRIADLSSAWQSIVFDGALAPNGMPAWKDYMTVEEVGLIKAYVVHEATLGHQRGERRVIRK